MRALSSTASTNDLRGQGVLLAMSTGQVITSASSPEILLWDTEVYKDIDGLHSTSTNTGRIVVPEGVTRMQFIALTHWEDPGATRIEKSALIKNGSLTYDGGGVMVQRNVTSMIPRNLVVSTLDVTGGDYFEIQCTTNDTSETLTVNQTYFLAFILR